jgi:hypothetical protein
LPVDDLDDDRRIPCRLDDEIAGDPAVKPKPQRAMIAPAGLVALATLTADR